MNLKKKKKKKCKCSPILLPPSRNLTDFPEWSAYGMLQIQSLQMKGKKFRLPGNMKWTTVYKGCSVLFTALKNVCEMVTGTSISNLQMTTRVKKAVGFCGEKKKSMLVISLLGRVSLYVRPTLVCVSYFLFDVFQEGCPGIHNCFEGIFTTRRHALVRVKQHSEFPIGFVDFIPTREQQSSVSATGQPPPPAAGLSGVP